MAAEYRIVWRDGHVGGWTAWSMVLLYTEIARRNSVRLPVRVEMRRVP